MKVFIGFICTRCGISFDVDSRTLKHSDPVCPICKHTNAVKRVFIHILVKEEVQTL